MKTNYEFMRDSMQLEFLKYDQQRMIEKFQMDYDGLYLYLCFVGRNYRVSRSSGKVEWSEDDFLHHVAANYNEAMSIFDILCYSKEGCHLSGRFSNINQLKGVVQSSYLGNKMFQESAEYFDGKMDLLSKACEGLGGKKEKVGDVSYCLYPFKFLPMMLQFWNSDDEFPASLKIMWDENIMDFVHYETTYFIVSHVLSRLRELMEQADKIVY